MIRNYSYINGNYTVKIFGDGTKIRKTIDKDATEFIPEFPESFDFNITNHCDGGCPWCYAENNINGKHADLMNLNFLDTIHPYTEIAINGNDLTHPDLIPFLNKMKQKKVIVSMTVNQKHFEKKEDFIKELIDKELIYGLGVSLVNPTNEFIERIKKYPNAVIHTINGLLNKEILDKLSNNGLKILILGYKELGRGIQYKESHNEIIEENKKWLKHNLKDYLNKFEVVSFDNLSIKQLDVKSLMSNDEWDSFYQGDDGSHTLFIDGVKKEFACSSLSRDRYPLKDNIIDMFEVIRNAQNKV